jgi:hypothetical protein
MARPAEQKAQLRAAYVFQRMDLPVACKKLRIPEGTAKRWKLEASKSGDDWDKARAAVAMGDQHFNALTRKLLEDYLVQHQATMDMLRTDAELTAQEKAETLASMADSLNKTMAAFKRVAPGIDKQSVQLDVLQRLAEFVRAKHPRHLGVLVELLEPFGEELARSAA